MQQKLIYIFYGLLFSLTAKAQVIEWSNPQKIKSKTLYSQIIGESTSGIFILKCRNTDFENDLIIEKYKSNLALETSEDLPITINGIVERVILIDNLLYAFITAKNNNTGKIDILVQKIDENIKAIGTPTVLGSVEQNNYIEKRHLQIKTSADKNRISVMFLTKNNQSSFLNLWVYNRQMQQAYAKQFTINKFHKDVFITNYEVSNFGDVYLLIDYPQNKEEQKVGDVREFFVYGYSPLSDKMLQYALVNQNELIEDFTLTLSNYNNTVSVFGLYSKPGVKGVVGQFSLRINIATALVEHKTYLPIDFGTFYKSFTGKIIDKQNELNNFYIRKIIARSDGGIIAIAEKYYQTRQVYTYYTNNFPQTSTRTIYNYDDVAIINLNPLGVMENVNWIKKTQSSTNDGGYLSSIYTLPTNDNLYFIFNQDNGSDNDIMMSYISFQGKFDTKILAKNANFSAAIIPTETKQTSGNSALICSIKDKRFSLMRITF